MAREPRTVSKTNDVVAASDAFVSIIFVDTRGFTRWAEAIEVFNRLNEFIRGFLDLINANFPSDFVKPLGDGAMIVRSVQRDMASGDLRRLLTDVLERISR